MRILTTFLSVLISLACVVFFVEACILAYEQNFLSCVINLLLAYILLAANHSVRTEL